jgi:glucoamylase
MELRSLQGDKLLGEPRFNPDGSLDVLQWSRPQYDGPALRALACLGFIDSGAPITAELRELLRIDLDFTCRHAGQPCVGPWEEESARHAYVLLVQLGALVHGEQWAERDTEGIKRGLYDRLEEHWSEPHRFFVATVPVAQPSSAENLLDASFLLGILDADLPGGPLSVADPRVQATQQAIEELFEHALEINRTKFRGQAPALGRYGKDRYFGGGAWLPTTLAAASFYYRRAQLEAKDRKRHIARADGFLSTVRELTPADGFLPEQVNSATGEPASARHLTWSYAAFISAALARNELQAVDLDLS